MPWSDPPSVAKRVRALLVALVPVAWAACAGVAVADPLPRPEDVVAAMVQGGDPAAVAGGMDGRALDDERWLNTVRLGLKAAGHAQDARRLLSALADRRRTDAVLYNLSLAYVDQLPGHNLLNKGYLSTASVRVIDEILERRPGDWRALHIRGLNNLYWPDWFGRAQRALVDLGRAVEAGRPMLTEAPDQDGFAASYLALGDALALTDKPAEARKVWADGVRAYPEVAAFAERLALPDAVQHPGVRAARDSDKPIDTDLTRLTSGSAPGHLVRLVGGTLFGPGPLEDQELSPGGLSNLRLGRPLMGSIAQMNNGTGEPHMPGEIAVGKKLDGLFSDGTPVNKNIDVGHVFLMKGKFRLFLAAVAGGPNGGVVHFYLDRFWNWTIQDDIGIDPGFDAGVIKFENFTFSSSPRLLPVSTQSRDNEPGGVDRAGTLRSGDFVVGLLGDDARTGMLDGTFNAIGSFPLDSVLLPGAPFAQTRVFRTDIAIPPQLAGFLTLANAISYLRAAAASAAERLEDDGDRLTRGFQDRMVLATAHFAKADAWLRSLDDDGRAAYARLTTPPKDPADAAGRLAFVCAATADLSVLADRLALVHSQTDASRLADLVPCGAR